MKDLAQKFVALVEELREDGWDAEDILSFYENGDWPSIAVGQEFNTLLDLAEDDADTLLELAGLKES